MAAIAITPQGPFSLAASGRFPEGFAPARYHGHAPDGAIRLALPADGGHATAGAAGRQAAGGTVLADLTGDAEPAAAPPSWPASSPPTPTAAVSPRSPTPTRSWPN